MSEPLTIEDPPKRKRWLRYSLRTLLLMVAILCVFLAIEQHRVRQQRRLIANVERLGGWVGYKYRFTYGRRFTDNYWTLADVPGLAPAWLISLLGEEHFLTPMSIYLNSPFNGSSFPQRVPEITDSDLAMLAEAANVKIMQLQNFPEVTDAGLKHLRHVPQLETLMLFGGNVTGSCFADIPTLEHLWTLYLYHTPIDDEGIQHLARYPALNNLYLTSTAVTQQGLAHLPPLLTALSIDGVRLTDDGLSHLARLSSLAYLSLDQSDTTVEGRAELQAALPNCKITWNP